MGDSKILIKRSNFLLSFHYALFLLFIGTQIPLYGQSSLNEFDLNQLEFQPKSIPGLGDFVVIDIYKDSFGFMWFATEGGLYRYGGDRARPYLYDPSDSTRLTSNVIKSLYEDQNQNLWAITNAGGANRINLKTGGLTTFKEDPDSTTTSTFSISDNLIFNIVESNSGNIWILGDNEGNEIIQNQDFTTTVSYPYSNLLEEIRYASMSDSVRSRLIFLGWKEGLLLYDPIENTFYHSKISDYTQLMGDVKPALNRHKPSSSVFLIDESLTIYNIRSSPFEITSISIKNIYPDIDFTSIKDVYSIDDKTCWIMTQGQGIYQVDWEQKTILHFPDHGKSELNSFGILVYSIYLDDQNYLWASTETGLHVLNLNTKPFRYLKPVVDEQSPEKAYDIASLLFDHKQRLWMSTYYNVHWYNAEDGNLVNNIDESIFPAKLQDAFIRTIYQDQNNRFWFGTETEGIWRSDSNLKNFKHYSLPGAEQTLVRDISEDKNGKIWFGVDWNNGGLFYYSEREDDIKYSSFPGYSMEESYPKPVTKLQFTSSGELWLGTWNEGLYFLDFQNDTTLHFKHKNSGNAGELSNNIITDIALAFEEEIWIATWENGLSKGSKIQEFIYHFKNFSVNEGIIAPDVHSVQSDKKGKLWAAAGNDVYFIDPSSNYVQRFSESEGLSSEKFVVGAKEVDSKGRIYFGNESGLISFNPSEIKTKIDSMSVYITELRIKNEPVFLDTLTPFIKKLKLNHNQNFLTFQYAAQDYLEPQSVVYEHKLEGVDKDWVKGTQQGFGLANYTQLSPGEYTFKVRSRAYSNVWEGELSIPIIITPPIWKTTWFLSLSFLVLITGFVAIIRRISYQKLKTRNRQLEIQQRIQSERERISRDLHDNVGAQMTNLITGLEMTKLKFDKGDENSVRNFLEVLNTEARVTMHELRETIWLMDYETISIKEFVQHTRRYFRKQLITNGTLEVYVNTQCDDHLILKSSVSLHLLRIIQEAFNNTCKHAEANNFEINISETSENSLIRIDIRDDGKGMDMEAVNDEGNGLRNMKSRAQQIISAQLEIHSEPGKGTTIKLYCPIP